MNSNNRRRCHTTLSEVDVLNSRIAVGWEQNLKGKEQKNIAQCQNPIQTLSVLATFTPLHSQQVLIVNSRRRNGLILYQRYYADFAGPGAAVGGIIDMNCHLLLPVGNLSLVEPQSADERQHAYLIRRQWIRLMKQITDNPDPIQRAQMILNQFDNYFDVKTITQIPDEALGLLVGVFPQTIRKVRQELGIRS